MLNTDRSQSLRNALKANGIVAALSAVVLLIGDGLVAALLQAYDALGRIHLAGVILALFAAFLFWLAGRERVDPTLTRAAISIDLLWVAGCAIAIGVGLTQGQGTALVALGATAFFVVAIAQLQGLKAAMAGGILIGR
jgi:hypothetical protein